MITQRSQYKFAIPPVGMVIDGGIMPARDVAGDGSWRVLRGEDACFLLEAARRVQLYRTYGASVSQETVDGAIKASVMQAAISGIASYPSHEYNGVEYSFAGEPELNYSYAMDVGTGDVVSAVLSNARSQFVPASSPSDISGGLYADAIRKAYYDLRKSGFFVYSGSLGRTYYGSIVSTQKNYARTNGQWELSSQSSSQLQPPVGNVVSISKRYYQIAGGTGSDTTYNWTLTQLPPSVASVPTPLSQLGSAVDCYAVFTVTATASSGSSMVTYHDAIVRGCIINADGVVELASPLTAQGVRGAVNGARGLPIAWNDVDDGDGVSISTSPCAVVFYDPEIDTSEIDWKWEPPAAA